MASQAKLRSEPTPPATVSGVADTPRHIPSGNARDEASTVPFEGFNQRKSSMKASKASDDPAQAVPTVKAGSDSESTKASTLHPGFTVSVKPPRPNNNSDGRHGAHVSELVVESVETYISTLGREWSRRYEPQICFRSHNRLSPQTAP